jgi:hypothetical protein
MDWIAAGFARLWLFSSASCLFSQPWALETFTTDWAVACRHFSVYMASSLLGEVAVAISTDCQFASAVHPSTDASIL